MKDFIEWLVSFRATTILEFPTREDPMVVELLKDREDIFTDYQLISLDSTLASFFTVSHKVQISSSRFIYVLEPILGESDLSVP